MGCCIINKGLGNTRVGGFLIGHIKARKGINIKDVSVSPAAETPVS